MSKAGFAPTVQKHFLDSMKVLDRPASVFGAGAATPIFTVVRGYILLVCLTGRVVVQIAAGANTMTLAAPGGVALDDGAVSINAMAVGTNLVTPGNVGVVTSVVRAAAIAVALPWDCVVGNFTCTCTAATTPGTIRFSLAYIPCTEDTIVIVA